VIGSPGFSFANANARFPLPELTGRVDGRVDG